MDTATLKSLFDKFGFTPADHVADFGYVIPYVLYYQRNHLYVTAVFYDDALVETFVEVYRAKKNTRVPKGIAQNWVNSKCDKAVAARDALLNGGYMPERQFLVRSEAELMGTLE